MKEETYSIHVKCENCDYKSSTPLDMVVIPKGLAIEPALTKKDCPKCGCTTLVESRY